MPTSNTPVQLSYQVCPIMLTGGIASQISGGILPMLALVSTALLQIESQADINDLDDAFGAFNVLPGGTLVTQSIGKYPFANQYVAANAVIHEPLTISVIMDAPMRGPNAWEIKHATMTNLKMQLDNHNDAGGLYTIAAPRRFLN